MFRDARFAHELASLSPHALPPFLSPSLSPTSAAATVEGGHRAILFSRLGGVQSEVYAEGLHFRIPWFQWPIIFDIRAKPHRISSISGTKG